MSESNSFVLRIGKEAALYIRRAVERSGASVETGGLLIGFHRGKCTIVQSVTAPKHIKNLSMTAFDLDVETHKMQAASLMKKHQKDAKIIGVWHTHVCDADFSKSDHIAHREMRKAFGNAFSLLIVVDKMRWKYRAVYLDEHNWEHRVSVIQ